MCLLKYEMDIVCERCLRWFMILFDATCSSARCSGGLTAGEIILDSKERSKVKTKYFRVHHNNNHQTLMSI